MSLGNQGKYCNACGEMIPMNAVSCSNCGASVAEVYSWSTTSPEKPMFAGGSNRIQRDEGPFASPSQESSTASYEQLHESVRKIPDSKPPLSAHEEKIQPDTELYDPKPEASTGRIIGIKELTLFPLSDVHGFLGRIFLFSMLLLAIPITSTALGKLMNEAAMVGAIIPAILIIGYLVETMRSIHCGMHRPARWGSIKNIFFGGIFGLMAFLMFIVVPFSIGYWLGTHGQSIVIKIAAGIFTFQGLVGILWTGLAQIRFVETDNWNALFDYNAILQNLKSNWKEYIISFFISLLVFPLGFLYAIFTMFAMPFWVISLQRNEPLNPYINPAKYFAISIMKRISSASFFSLLFGRRRTSMKLIILFYFAWGIGMYAVGFGFDYWYIIICTACFAHVYMGNKIRLRGFDAAIPVLGNYYQQVAMYLQRLAPTIKSGPALFFGIIILLLAGAFGIYIVSQKSGSANRTSGRVSRNQIAQPKPAKTGKAAPTKLSSAEIPLTQQTQKANFGEIPATQKRIWPLTSKREITINDLQHLSAHQLEIMRNEIYAVHGWNFQREDLQNYFERQSWYHPRDISIGRDSANKYALHRMSELELRNAQFIKDYEQQKGYRK